MNGGHGWGEEERGDEGAVEVVNNLFGEDFNQYEIVRRIACSIIRGWNVEGG